MKRINVSVLILVVALFVVLLVKESTRVTKKFSIKAITSATPSDPAWATQPCPEDLTKVFDQKFTYLSRGGQCFVFLSDDRKYVLKFFRQGKYSKPVLGDAEERHRKKIKAFESYKIAYEKLKEETGLLFLHLVANDGFHKQVTLIDHNKQTLTLELGAFEFFLQKAADPLMPALEKMKSEGNLEKAKETLDKLFAFMERRRELKIVDLDPAIATNFGLVDGTIRQFDVGRFLHLQDKDLLMQEKKELRKKNRLFVTWLKENYPELYPYYLERSASLEAN